MKRAALRVISSFLVLFLGLGLGAGSSYAASGNNGTVKVVESGADPSKSNDNDPHVCHFSLYGAGFDASSSGSWSISAFASSSSGNANRAQLRSGTWRADAKGSWTVSGPSLSNGHYELNAKQSAPSTSGGDKSKVFWVSCGSSSTTSTPTPTARATATPAPVTTPVTTPAPVAPTPRDTTSSNPTGTPRATSAPIRTSTPTSAPSAGVGTRTVVGPPPSFFNSRPSGVTLPSFPTPSTNVVRSVTPPSSVGSRSTPSFFPRQTFPRTTGFSSGSCACSSDAASNDTDAWNAPAPLPALAPEPVFVAAPPLSSFGQTTGSRAQQTSALDAGGSGCCGMRIITITITVTFDVMPCSGHNW